VISSSVPEIPADVLRGLDDWHQAAAVVLARHGKIVIEGEISENPEAGRS
jgi:hypothetical protein